MKSSRSLWVFILFALLAQSAFAERGNYPADGGESPISLLLAYEEGLEAITVSGTSREKATTLYALASLGSPRYIPSRDRLLPDPEPIVRLGLLEAMSAYGDRSEAASSHLEECLQSSDWNLCSRAIIIHQNTLKVPLRFQAIWSPDEPTPLWRTQAARYGLDISLLDGIGDATPWKDECWKSLSEELQIRLLSRAGTREAITLLKERAGTFFQNLLLPAEAPDPALFRELLASEEPDLVFYASRSLIEAGDQKHLADLQDLAARIGAGEDIASPEQVLSDHAVYFARQALDTDVLKSLARRFQGQWLHRANNTLYLRGEPLTYRELTEYCSAEARAHPEALPDSTLRTIRLRALIRERLFSELPGILDAVLEGDPASTELRSFNRHLRESPLFLGEIPDDVAESCTAPLEEWIAKAASQSRGYFDDRSGLAEATLTLGLLLREGETEKIWKAWIEQAAPFDDPGSAILVLAGSGERSRELRGLFSRKSGRTWFTEFSRRLGGIPTRLADTEMAEPFPCPDEDNPLPYFIRSLPGSSSALEKLKADLLGGLRNGPAFSGVGWQEFFLEVRGFGGSTRSDGKWEAALSDPRDPVRMAALRCIKSKCPSIWRNHREDSPEDLMESLQRRCVDASGSILRPDEPPHVLSPEDVSRLEEMLWVERNGYFQRLLDTFHQQEARWTSCGFPSSDKAARKFDPPVEIPLPSKIFLKDGLEYEHEIRGLLESEDVEIRHAAAWVLWRLFHDPDALKVFVKDASLASTPIRARALNVLQLNRCSEAAPLYPPLLSHSEPVLRIVGLRGVAAFRITSSLPEVENLITDPVVGVAVEAVSALGRLHPPEARPLLIRLLDDGCPLRDPAATALIQYRGADDVDAFAEALKNPSSSQTKKRKLLWILKRITKRPAFQFVGEGMGRLRDPISEETIEEWVSWWASHRDLSVEERLRSVITDLVNGCLDEENENRRRISMAALGRLFPRIYSLNPAGASLNPKARKLLLEWRESQERLPLWEILTSQKTKPLGNLDILFDLDAGRAREYIFSKLVGSKSDRLIGRRLSSDQAHLILVEAAGVDFGNPGAARCGAGEKIVQDWETWGRKNGWTR